MHQFYSRFRGGTVEPPRGPVETEFLRPLLLGRGIPFYRLLSSALAVLPLAEEGILTPATVADWGYRHVAAWMRDIEAKWQLHCSKRADCTLPLTTDRADRSHGALICQNSSMSKAQQSFMPYSAFFRMRLSVDEPDFCPRQVSVYLTSVHEIEEARYLSAILNSAVVLKRVSCNAAARLARSVTL